MLKQIGVVAGTPSETGADGVAQVGTNLANPLPEVIDAIALDSANADAVRAAGELAGRYTSVLMLLADAIDCREQFNPGSSLRVLEHAGRFAESLGLDATDRIILERGALLRDIGKLRVPNEALLKYSLLDYDEWQTLQAHTVLGAELAESIPGLSYVAPIARHHHECYDGTGYPDGLEGSDIPFLARVVKIVDVYCAMTSPRVYRALTASRDEAFEHLREERGKHFDPELVDLFLEKNVADTLPLGAVTHAIE